MNEIDIKRVASFAQLQTKAVGSIVVGLDLNNARVYCAAPASKDVAAGHVLTSDNID